MRELELASKGVVICAAPPASPDARYRRIPSLALGTSGGLNSTPDTPHAPVFWPDLASFFSLLFPSCLLCDFVGFGLGIGLGWIAESPLQARLRHVLGVLDTDSASPRPSLGIASSLRAVR